MKRLFKVSHRNKKVLKKAGIPSSFPNKQEAKKTRDEAGGIKSGFFVTLDVDHWRYKS